MKKGDIYLFNLSDGIGHEQSGDRPGILVSSLVNNMFMVVPLTTNLDSLRFSHTLSIIPNKKNNLKTESVALVFQLKSLDKSRAVHHLGRIDLSNDKSLNQILKDLLSL